MTLQQARESTVTAADLVDRILDKGLVINADIKVSVVGVELLDIRIRAALASFETAAKYGLEFPSGTRLPEWAGKAEAALSGNGSGETSAADRPGVRGSSA
ncbi:MAG: gas vesicle protein [Deltaproteobacteria bacterium]|nr:gas vesicle protein [Deltaproteobacteria bacterium]